MIDWLAYTHHPFSSIIWIKIGIGAFALIFASITDLKTREVPDMLNYGLIIFGVLLAALLSLDFKTYDFFLESMLGLAVFFAFSAFMFYSGQWGGGDAKMLMGLGALFGIPLALQDSFLIGFLVNLILAGAVYGLLWSIGLAIWQRKKFVKRIKQVTSTPLHAKLRIIWILCVLAVLITLLFVSNSPLRILLLFSFILPPFIYYLWLFVKGVEQSAMLVNLPPSKLTEGDWIAKNVVYKGKTICGPKDLGINKKQIQTLKKLHAQGKIKDILVKQGIPFIPSFLLAYALTIVIGNPLLMFI